MMRAPDDLRRRGDLAAAVVRSAPSLVANADCLSDASAHAAWTASRSRSAGWDGLLRGVLTAADAGPLGPREQAAAVAAAADVLSSEMLARLWSAVAAEHGRRHGGLGLTLATRSLHDQLRARVFALKLMTHPTALRADFVADLDALRRRAERWTDCLLAALPAGAGLAEVDGVPLAFDAGRCRDFAEDGDLWHRLGGGWPLAELTLRVGLPADRAAADRSRPLLDAIADVVRAAGEARRPASLSFRRLFPRT